MKNKIFNFVIIMITALSMLGCEPEPIDIKFNQAPSKLVISSVAILDRYMLVTVTRSFTALEGSKSGNVLDMSESVLNSILVKNAIVTVSYKCITDTLKPEEGLPGFYGSHKIYATDYETYTLNVYDAASGQSVHASSLMLPRVKVDSTQTKSEIENIGGIIDTVSTVKIAFNDPAGIPNWYVASYFSGNNLTRIRFDREAIRGLVLNRGGYKKGFFLFDDKDFDGQTHQQEIPLDDIVAGDSVGLLLLNVNESYYKFLKASQKEDLFSVLTEPYTYQGNVINGYGFFNAHKGDLRLLVVKE